MKDLYSEIGKRVIYKSYEDENCVIRIDLKGDAYVKFKGKEEFKAKPESKVVADSNLKPMEITKEEYDNF